MAKRRYTAEEIVTGAAAGGSGDCERQEEPASLPGERDYRADLIPVAPIVPRYQPV